ncbi:MAG: DUF4249 domain-containing protein [Prevotellaceae bacterium]|jgi:hypothetical protein|nr:DUF4249 domain-containing protein [Prevotellaceae bacterium]
MRYFFLPFLFAVMLTGACVERVTIDTNSQSPKLVVVAMLTTDTVPQVVTLTQSTNFFGGDTCPVVSTAKVWINDTPLPFDAEKGAYVTQGRFDVKSGALYKLRILCDMNGDGADEEFWAEDVVPHSISIPQVILTPLNMDIDTNRYAPPFIVSAIFMRSNTNDNYVRVTEYYQGKQRTEKLSQYAVGSVPYGFTNVVPVPTIATITRSGFLLDGQPDTVFYCPFDTVSFGVSTLSEALFRYITTAQTESRGSNPMFGGAPANAESNIHGENVVGCFGAYAAGKPKSIVLPMNTKTLDGDNIWFNLKDTSLCIGIREEGTATYLTGARAGELYFQMQGVDHRIKGFWAHKGSDVRGASRFEMKSYDEFWGEGEDEKWHRGRGRGRR